MKGFVMSCRAACALVGVFVSIALADQPLVGHVSTYARVPMVMDHPELGHVELYEFDAWLNRAGLSESHVRRAGAPPYEGTTHNGYIPFDVPPGRYALMLHQPEWFLRATIIPDFLIRPGDNAARNVTPGLDYACLCGGDLNAWKKPGLPDPWEAGTVFHQTFVARGTSITHAHYKLAGADATSTRVSIHEATGTKPDQWKQVGPERIDEKIGALNDNWVGWRSGEIITTPGRRYALRIEGLNDGGSRIFSPLVHRDALGPGYEKGTAFADGRRQAYDLYATVSSDSDGNCIPYMRVHDFKPGELAGGGRWSQTWIAQGQSLAGIDLLVSWGQDHKSVHAEVSIHENEPSGESVGVRKLARPAWWAPNTGFLGATWLPGEVTLKPGKTYCATFTPVAPCTGYNPSKVNHIKNAYAGGCAYRDGKEQPEVDLEMTVVEYTEPGQPTPIPGTYEPRSRNLLTNGDFEQGEPNTDSNYDPPGWKRWQTRKTAFWYGSDGRNKSGASRVIGGNINDTAINGGVVQQATGLNHRKRYRLSAWVNTSTITDKNYLAAIGYDPTGQTADPQAKTLVWTAVGNRSFSWEQVVVDDIKPRKSNISVWTRGSNTEIGYMIFHVDFDDIVLEEQ